MADRLDRAIYDTAHDFAGGVPAMAARINALTEAESQRSNLRSVGGHHG